MIFRCCPVLEMPAHVLRTITVLSFVCACRCLLKSQHFQPSSKYKSIYTHILLYIYLYIYRYRYVRKFIYISLYIFNYLSKLNSNCVLSSAILCREQLRHFFYVQRAVSIHCYLQIYMYVCVNIHRYIIYKTVSVCGWQWHIAETIKYTSYFSNHRGIISLDTIICISL